MPEILCQSEIKLDWADVDKWRQIRLPGLRMPKRSGGVHLSGIIKYVLTTLGKLTPETLIDEMPMRMALGMAWENWVVGLMPDGFVWQPGEWEKEGVFGTPDGISFLDPTPDGVQALCVEEFKATWKSERSHGDVLKESIWMWQLAGNCYALNTTCAQLHVLWVNGDYRTPVPKYTRYLIRFQQKELDGFWRNVVMKNKDQVGPEVH